MLIVFLLVFGVIIRVEVSSLGANEDSVSNYLNSRIFLDGKSIYASTDRYNYGPIHFYILGVIASFEKITGQSNVERFHRDVALFLALVDCGIFAVLYKMFGKIPAIFYILSPISILISGFHGQHDNSAILLGLIGWGFYLKSQKTNSNKYYFASAVFLGLSLATKHIFYLFPLWILFIKDAVGRKFSKRMIFLSVVYGIFIAGFAFELLREPQVIDTAWSKMIQNVFKYRSVYGYSFFYKLIGLLMPIKLLEDAFQWVPIFKGFTFFYMLVLSLYGIAILRLRKDLAFLPLYYLAAFFALSPAVADQYVVIPLAVACVFYFRLEMVLYVLVTIIYLCVSGEYNIGGLQSYSMSTAANMHVVGLTLPFFFRTIQYNFTLISSQAYIFIFCLTSLFCSQKSQLPIKNRTRLLRFLGQLLLPVITVISLIFLVVFVWEKKTPEEGKIHIMSATYGWNCGTEVGNMTKQESERCNGLRKCAYNVGPIDPAPGCAKDYSVTWSCAKKSDKVYVSYKAFEIAEAYGKKIEIVCSKN